MPELAQQLSGVILLKNGQMNNMHRLFSFSMETHGNLLLSISAFDQLIAGHQGAEGDEVVGGDDDDERVGADLRPSDDRTD